MLLLENLTISEAISVSRIWDSAAVVFSTTLSRLLIVCSNLFWYAPRVALCSFRVLIAFPIDVIALAAFAAVETDVVVRLRPAVLIDLIVSLIWFALVP